MTWRGLLALFFTALAGGLTAVLLSAWLLPSVRLGPGASPPAVAPDAPPVGPLSYADAVARATPSVVNIYSSKVTTERQALMFRDPLLQRFFGNLLPEQTRRHLDTSLGSGVIVTADGYLLTNHHIIKDADQIKVVLDSGRSLKVRVLGNDPETDLAVLEAEGDGLPAIPIGDLERLQVGDVVLAIGNPFGVGQTVTMGIVSATGRNHLGINAIENFIQTDAAVNPGNSGGALVNARGELIGINSAIYSHSGASHGIGFAIPVDLARGVMEQILQQGRVVRGWIGITGQDVTADLAAAFGLTKRTGVLISGTVDQGPAERAGLRAGDVITQVNGRGIQDTQALFEAISGAGPARRLQLVGWRGSQRIQVSVRTVERPVQVQR